MNSYVKIENLKKYFPTAKGILHAVDGISLEIEKGKTLGVVGESGCGKSTLGRMLVHLERSTDGRITFDGEDVTDIRGKKLHRYREQVQIIFQDPYSSLNPRMSVREIIEEPLRLSGRYPRKEIQDRAQELMETVGVDSRLAMSYPHELDGGRRQRVVIARAIALRPGFIICDEPVSALDVSIQAQVLNLLKQLQKEQNLTYMFISHDLSVVRHISHYVCVMYLGQMVEYGTVEELFANPMHPYTKALLAAIPSTDLHAPRKEILLEGEIVSPVDPKPGCRFGARCPYATDECRQEQKLVQAAPGHMILCCNAGKIRD